MLGLLNLAKAKRQIDYLLFYDIDRTDITKEELDRINDCCFKHHISYLIYKTKHGYHFVGLSPLTAYQWANAFSILRAIFDSYYAGHTIRLSRKENELQVLVKKELGFGKVIPNLYNLYCQRFNLEKMPWSKETAEYLLEFEKYKTVKE